jgi:uncharacterized paraquat-inducible protein A
MSDDWKGEEIIRNVARAANTPPKPRRKGSAALRMCRNCSMPLPNGEAKRVVCHACTRELQREQDRKTKRPLNYPRQF